MQHPAYDPSRWTMPQWCARLSKEPVWQRGLFLIETKVPAVYREAVKNHYRTVIMRAKKLQKN